MLDSYQQNASYLITFIMLCMYDWHIPCLNSLRFRLQMLMVDALGFAFKMEQYLT